MVRQACVRGMGEGDFTEEAEWMSWVLEDQLSLGACRDGTGDTDGQSVLQAVQCK